jgi:hypothetical protein
VKRGRGETAKIKINSNSVEEVQLCKFSRAISDARVVFDFNTFEEFFAEFSVQRTFVNPTEKSRGNR